MPPAGGTLPGFCDDPDRGVEIESATMPMLSYLCFCGFTYKLGISLSAVHRWLGRLPQAYKW
jgi:hypothetical protein